jgi:hypothetical protein
MHPSIFLLTMVSQSPGTLALFFYSVICVCAQTLSHLHHLTILSSFIFSILELRSAVSENRFLQAVRRIQHYMECYADNRTCQNERGAAFYVSFQAWKALRDYTKMLHQKTYREYSQLLANPNIPNRCELLQSKRLYMSKLGEYTCGSEAGFFRVQTWGQGLQPH